MDQQDMSTIDAIAQRIEHDDAFRTVPPDTVEKTVEIVWAELRRDAAFSTFLPVIAERTARERLRSQR
jgi:hypothetical protein